jgi:hypothetical protein
LVLASDIGWVYVIGVPTGVPSTLPIVHVRCGVVDPVTKGSGTPCIARHGTALIELVGDVVKLMVSPILTGTPDGGTIGCHGWVGAFG